MTLVPGKIKLSFIYQSAYLIIDFLLVQMIHYHLYTANKIFLKHVLGQEHKAEQRSAQCGLLNISHPPKFVEIIILPQLTPWKLSQQSTMLWHSINRPHSPPFKGGQVPENFCEGCTMRKHPLLNLPTPFLQFLLTFVPINKYSVFLMPFSTFLI